MREARRGWAERLLGWVAGEDAAAVYGDLVEMARGRGRVWFWAMWARTVARLGWRGPAAYVCGAFVTFGLMGSLFRMWRQIAPDNLRLAPAWFHVAGPAIASAAVPLWFLLTYGWLRYGVSDRFVRLTGALTVATTLAFLYVPWVSSGCAVLAVLIAGCAAVRADWRRPMLAVSAATVTGYVGIGCAWALRTELRLVAHGERAWAVVMFRVALGAALALEAYVCSRVYEGVVRGRAGVRVE